METTTAIAALSALAQEHRLEVFRLLVRAGEGGLPAGQIATALGIQNNTLSFHLDRLRTAGLVTQERQGRSIIYAANFAAMNGLIGYLTENCCAGHPEICATPAACAPGPVGATKKRRTAATR